MNEFDISVLFHRAFGYNLPGAFRVPPPGSGGKSEQAAPFELAAREQRKTIASLGSLIYAPDELLGTETFLPMTFSGLKNGQPFELTPSICVCSVSQKKTIVSTPLVDRVGAVKELVSSEDYVINIRGILIDPNNAWPEEQIVALRDLFKVDASITLRSALTDIFLRGEFDHKVVLKDFRLPSTAGVEHALPFEIDAESDGIYELEIF